MPRSTPRSPMLLVLLIALGCDRARALVGLGEEPAPAAPPAAEPSEDAKALAIAVGAMVPGSPRAPAPTQPPPPTIVTAPGPDELEVWDLAVEWKPTSGAYHYYGGGESAESLVFSGKARMRRSVGSKGEITIKARCDDGPESITDVELARIDDEIGEPMPAEGAEFRIGAHLFTKQLLPAATACTVVVALRDQAKSPAIRGSTRVCWVQGRKTVTPCAAPDALAPEPWSATDVQFLPTNEVGFALVAGTAPAPDRLGLRATCHVDDKHFVEFQYVEARLHALEPGDLARYRQQLTSAWEYMRFAECDVEVQAIKYDHEADKLIGVTEIGRRCMRPAGVREGRCAKANVEQPAVDPKGPPVVAAVKNANFTSYNGWYGAYAMAELTVLAPLPNDARFEFVATCGKHAERMPLTFPTPMELVYSGQSLRAQGSVSGRGRPKTQSCTTEFVLYSKDEIGVERRWSLGTQCYTRSGTSTACKGAPALPAAPMGSSGMLGLLGTAR